MSHHMPKIKHPSFSSFTLVLLLDTVPFQLTGALHMLQKEQRFYSMNQRLEKNVVMHIM